MRNKSMLLILLLFPIIGVSWSEFRFSFSPVLSVNNMPLLVDYNKATMREFERYLSMPPFADFSIEMSLPKCELVLRFDFRQVPSTFLKTGGKSNLPYTEGYILPTIDLNFPRVGFLEMNEDVLSFSLGRRKIAYGSSFYSFILSESFPYFDHLWINLTTGSVLGDLSYGFYAITSDRSIYNVPRTLIGHTIQILNENVLISVLEQNLVHGAYPDLEDLAPFILHHNTYQIGSNIMGAVRMEMSIGNVLGYVEFTLDDLITGVESNSTESNPNAFGWLVGGVISLLEGDEFLGPRMMEADYSVRKSSLLRGGGLKLRFEYYHSTTYMYNRKEKEGRFVNPLWIEELGVVNGFFGFPYGPDATLGLVGAEYENSIMKLDVMMECLRKGTIDIDSEYAFPYNENWYGLVMPISHEFVISAQARYLVNPKLVLLARAKIHLRESVKYDLSVGFSTSIDF